MTVFKILLDLIAKILGTKGNSCKEHCSHGTLTGFNTWGNYFLIRDQFWG